MASPPAGRGSWLRFAEGRGRLGAAALVLAVIATRQFAFGGDEAVESPALDAARKDLLAELPPNAAIALNPAQKEAQDRRARRAAQVLALVEVPLKLQTPLGTPLAGVEVRGLHEVLDVTDVGKPTGPNGTTTLRLPRGTWRLDVSSKAPKGGRLIFARTRIRVRDRTAQTLDFDNERTIRFRSRKGAVRAAHEVLLTWPDFSFYRRVNLVRGQIKIRTIGEEPMMLQAVRKPDESGGYVLRQAVGIETTEIETDPELGTEYVFRAGGGRRLHGQLTSADALPYHLSMKVKGSKRIFLSGLQETVVHLGVRWKGKRYHFFPRPFRLDGTRREFRGAPPFAVSVGHQNHDNFRYGGGRFSVSLRPFLREANGMLMGWDGECAYTIGWELLLDGNVHEAGSTKPAFHARTRRKVDPAKMGAVRYRVHVQGPGENRRVEVPGQGQTAVAAAGKVRVACFPEVEPNARMWAACVNDGARAYELTCPRRKHSIFITHWLQFPPGLAGLGGFAGGRGRMWLPEHPIYGFHGQWYWTGLLAHEMGHVYHYGHGNPAQAKRMGQAAVRAGRRYASIRRGMVRYPRGNRYKPLLEAVTRGAVRVDRDFGEKDDVDGERSWGEHHDTGSGILVPNLEITGDDAVFTWFYTSMYGDDVDAARRQNGAAWSWALTVAGFSDTEIQIAMMSRAAKDSLAWLARMRGILVYDHRIDAALQVLKGSRMPSHRERGAALAAWEKLDYAAEKDLAALAERARREIGYRPARTAAFAAIARQHLIRGDEDTALERLVEALVDARRGDATLFEHVLRECAVLWAAR